MHLKWLIPLALVMLPLAGCIEHGNDDAEFLNWLSASLSDVSELDNFTADALDEHDYDKIEVLADMSYHKNMQYYTMAKNFDVSDKYKELQQHAILFFYYHSQADINLKYYAQCMKEEDYFSAYDYICESLNYTNKYLDEYVIIDTLLGVD